MPSPPPPPRPPSQVMVNDSEGWNRAWGRRNKQQKINSTVTVKHDVGHGAAAMPLPLRGFVCSWSLFLLTEEN